MANFKTALEALAKGNMDIDALTKQLLVLLDEAPQHANLMLSQLDEIHDQKIISDQDYTKLKGHINEYRRDHSVETETGTHADDEATVFAHKPDTQDDADDKTQVISSNEGNTQESGVTGFDVTSGTDMGGTDIDLSDIHSPSTISVTETSDATWSEPSTQSPEAQTTALGPGSIIKQRFKLIDVLGIGGMGKVYKGLDLLKEEAKDKKPYCAIKLLNEDFKDHPEAFISLQRESSRQQKLAHPNIATIYDFDRIAGPGTPVYITMELMEGMELKDYIKKTVKKQNGLPFDEAFPMIKQMVDALAYAHDKRLVHSDLKPGNAFLCNDGTVKILDFGIARAVKNPVTGETEKTLFDPGKLGALTPAYASYEMLEGEEPDTRDDTYALGCMAYELLTGNHPFNKLPANKAKENKLKPPMVKGLKKKQNRALQRAIAFERKDRSPTIEHFLKELENKYIWYKSPSTIAAVFAVVISLGGTAPLLNYMNQRNIDRMITDINTGTPQVIVDRLEAINEFETTDQREIIDGAKAAIQDHFSEKIGKLTDTTGDKYDFPEAGLVLARVGKLYPDSSFYLEQSKHIETSKNQKLSTLYSKYSAALSGSSALLDNTKTILERIKTQIDPMDSLLTDPRASNQYRLLAQSAFDQGDLKQATTLITSGIALTDSSIKIAREKEQLASQDEQLQLQAEQLKYEQSLAQLKDVKNKIETKVDIIALEERLGIQSTRLASLIDYQKIKTDVIELTELNPESNTLTSIAASMQNTVTQELVKILTSGNREDAEVFVNEYGDILNALHLNKELTEMKLAHFQGARRSAEIRAIVNTHTSTIDESLKSPNIEDLKWESKILTSVGELDVLSKEDPSAADDLKTIRQKIAQLYIGAAQKTLDAERFYVAKNFINKGRRFAPDDAKISSMSATIEQAEVAYETTYKKKLLVDGLIVEFETKTKANDIAGALDYFKQLEKEIPDNVFVTDEAPRLISLSYERLAKIQFDAKKYANAVKFSDEGLKFDPDNIDLETARADYIVEENIIDLTQKFKSSIRFNIDDIYRKIEDIEISNPLRYSKFKRDSIKILVDRINKKLNNNEKDAAAVIVANAVIFFPSNAELEKLKSGLKLKPWPNTMIAKEALDAGELTEAKKILQNALKKFPTHPTVNRFKTSLETKITQANKNFDRFKAEKDTAGTDYKKLNKAKKFLSRAQRFWMDSPVFDEAEVALDKLINKYKPTSKKVIAREVINLESFDIEKPETALRKWRPIDSGRSCKKRLAGYGKRSKAVCYDFIYSGLRGPFMVVVPTGGEFSSHFAISRYEISVQDYSKYCLISKSCPQEKNKNLFNNPITGIALTEAKAYAEWISKRTGKTYRLPTASEWEYAAQAAGNKKMKKNYNCRVIINNKIVKGTGLVSVKTGQPNDWGLKHMIGNVQEWVIDGDKVAARGGAFEDVHSKCKVSFSKEHSGMADDVTGFRLMLEEVK